MRKIVMFNMISVDGYFTDANGGIEWHTVDEEFNRMAIENFDSIDTIMFGRVTYELFETYWPEAAKDPATDKNDLIIAEAIENIRKIVFSTTRDKVTWNNSEILKDIDVETIKRLKAEDGKNIIIYGSGSIVRQLSELGLIDKYNFMISATILGSGKKLFDEKAGMKLKLIESKAFNSNGNVLLSYAPAS